MEQIHPILIANPKANLINKHFPSSKDDPITPIIAMLGGHWYINFSYEFVDISLNESLPKGSLHPLEASQGEEQPFVSPALMI